MPRFGTKRVLTFKKSWMFTTDENRLIKKLATGTILNVCAGRSHIGTTFDLYEKADIKGDILHLPFREYCFDTVLVDPPFTLYWSRKLLVSIYYLAKMAKKRLIIVGGWTIHNFKGFSKDPILYLTKKRLKTVNIIFVYDRNLAT